MTPRNPSLVVFGCLAALVIAAAAPQPVNAQSRAMTVEEVLAITSDEQLTTLVNDRMEALTGLLKRATDWRSAREVLPALERTYLELQLIGFRLSMTPPLTEIQREGLAPQQKRFDELSAALRAELKRLAGQPAVRRHLASVLDPIDHQHRLARGAELRSLMSVLQTVRSQLELYRLQHRDRWPDFRAHAWEQLTSRTDANGAIVPAPKPGTFGPYLASPPRNPMTGSSGILLVRSAPQPGFRHADRTYGFVLDVESGRIWALDAEGRIFDEKGSLAAVE